MQEIAGARSKWPAEAIRNALDRFPEPRSLKNALIRRSPAIIAEVKKASPSAGVLRHDFEAGRLGRELERAGAAALSVLTEPAYFQGSLENLAILRWQTRIPLLRKDFIVDPYQVLEARHAGADAVLLIAALLDDSTLVCLLKEVADLEMEALVEVHSAEELNRAEQAGAALIGVNNRDLRSLEVSLAVSMELAAQIPKNAVAVSESGIRSAGDIRRLSEAGYRGFLIGAQLMRAPSPGAALGELLGSVTARARRSA